MKAKGKLLWTVALLAAAVIFWPRSFTPMFESAEEISAIIVTSDVENGQAISGSYSYHFTSEDAELDQIWEIVDRYTYRYCVASLFAGGVISGNGAGYWLSLYPIDDAGDMKSIDCAGTGKVSIADVRERPPVRVHTG